MNEIQIKNLTDEELIHHLESTPKPILTKDIVDRIIKMYEDRYEVGYDRGYETGSERGYLCGRDDC